MPTGSGQNALQEKARDTRKWHLYEMLPGHYFRELKQTTWGTAMPVDDEELRFCEARAEFAGLSEDEIWDAIEGDDYNENPITAEVARIGAEFLSRFKAYADERGGAVPTAAVHVAARCPIERVAILTLLRYVEVHSAGVRSAAVH